MNSEGSFVFLGFIDQNEIWITTIQKIEVFKLQISKVWQWSRSAIFHHFWGTRIIQLKDSGGFQWQQIQRTNLEKVYLIWNSWGRFEIQCNWILHSTQKCMSNTIAYICGECLFL